MDQLIKVFYLITQGVLSYVGFKVLNLFIVYAVKNISEIERRNIWKNKRVIKTNFLFHTQLTNQKDNRIIC